LQRLEWANLPSLARVQRDMIVIQQQAESTRTEVARIEELCRHNLSPHILHMLYGSQRYQLFRQYHRWVDSVLIWHLHSMEFIRRRGVVTQAKLSCKHIGFLRCGFTQRVHLQMHEWGDKEGLLLLSLQSECTAAQAEVASHEQLRQQMYACDIIPPLG